MKISQYKKRLESIEEAAKKKQDALGEKFRQEVLIPFCRKYRLEYVNFNDFFFVKRVKKYQNGEVVGETDYDSGGYWGNKHLQAFFDQCEEYQEVVKTLETITFARFEFGYSVNTVRKGDL